MTGEVLCRLADLDATGAKEIVLERNGARLPVFVAKGESRIFGYVNSCPHARLPLNWREDAFLTSAGRIFFAPTTVRTLR